MMKVQLLLPLTIMASVTMVLILKTRKREEDREDRRFRFESIRLRVTIDVLTEHQNEKATLQQQYDNAKEEEGTLREASTVFQSNVLENMGKLDTCHQEKRQIKSQLDSEEKNLNTLITDMKTETDIWLAEIDSLKNLRSAKSPACKFLQPNSDQERLYCRNTFIVEPRPPEPKPAVLKPPMPKAALPKAPVPNAPEQKAPEPKVPQPKPMAVKVAEPKAADPNAAQPEAEEPKPDQPVARGRRKVVRRVRRKGRPAKPSDTEV
ncbi:uncharacterized protein LOC128746531 [Synchiropus splendidus]|uniref:uncharacterized protein LOC128746531 n=1 Tax=Synchiropus splendidus TaxID=270530 RepID=UPI00237DD2F0|nr:uncharacterized protein LOC128746531 [Synchiropus splendidus]